MYFLLLTFSKLACGIVDFSSLLFDIFARCLPNIRRLISTYQCISRMADAAARPNSIKAVTRWKQTERETWMGRKGVYMSHICSDPAAFWLHFPISSLCCCAQDIWPTQNVCIWHPRKETQQSTISPTSSTFQFNSLWFILIWYEIQLALHKNGQ